jgi:hypothetical protein
MAGYVAKFVGNKVFKETAKNKFGGEDPYFETVPATRLGVIKTTKKKRKALPPGLTDEEAKILTKVKRRAYRLDLCLFNCCGTRFGWGAVVGIVPAIGDVLDLILAYMVVKTCEQVNPPLPASVRAKMQMNLAIDFIIGLVPFIGDIADAIYKCNTRNAVLLENELRKRGERRLRDANHQHEVDPSLPEIYDAGSDEDFAPSGPPPRYTSTKEPKRPDRTYDSRNKRGGGGWSGGRQDADLEAQVAPAQPPRPGQSRL